LVLIFQKGQKILTNGMQSQSVIGLSTSITRVAITGYLDSLMEVISVLIIVICVCDSYS
jgi:hypothetical protein